MQLKSVKRSKIILKMKGGTVIYFWEKEKMVVPFILFVLQKKIISLSKRPIFQIQSSGQIILQRGENNGVHALQRQNGT
jgi:hypothetical protein